MDNQNTHNIIEPMTVDSCKFSWRRLFEFARFYSPLFSKQLLIYLAFSLLLSILMLLPTGPIAMPLCYSLCWMVIPYLFSLAPLILTKWGDNRIIERLIPASALEKFVFYMLYFLVAIPCSTHVLPLAANYLYSKIPLVSSEEMIQIYKLQFSNPMPIKLINFTGAILPPVACLYFVLKSKTGRIIKGVLSVFGAQIFVGILGAIYGIVGVFNTGFDETLMGKDANSQQVEQFTKELMQEMVSKPIHTALVVSIIAISVIAFIYLIYRHLKKGNI